MPCISATNFFEVVAKVDVSCAASLGRMCTSSGKGAVGSGYWWLGQWH